MKNNIIQSQGSWIPLLEPLSLTASSGLPKIGDGIRYYLKNGNITNAYAERGSKGSQEDISEFTIKEEGVTTFYSAL